MVIWKIAKRYVCSYYGFSVVAERKLGGGHNFDEKKTLEINLVFNCSFFPDKKGL